MTTLTSYSIFFIFDFYFNPMHSHRKPIHCLVFSVIEFYDAYPGLSNSRALRLLISYVLMAGSLDINFVEKNKNFHEVNNISYYQLVLQMVIAFKTGRMGEYGKKSQDNSKHTFYYYRAVVY